MSCDELRDAQARRAVEEARAADEAAVPADSQAHERRAEKAEYLRERLDEAARADRAAEGPPPA